VNKKLQKARIGLLLDEPFFGALLLNLKVVEQKGIGTMATDSVKLAYDPEFTEKLSDIELKTVLAHEALHCALLHPLRRGDRDWQTWNRACDYAINQLLIDTNESASSKGRPQPFKLPEGGLIDSKFKGKTADEIYAELYQKPQPKDKPGDKPNKDPGGMGGVEDHKAGSQSEQTEQEARWKVALTQAASMAKSRGDIPGELKRLIEDILEPKADWRELLRRFVRDRAKDDYSWSKINTRYAQSGFMLPSLDSQRMGKIAVAIDTSGSIDQEMLNSFMTEVESIVHEVRPSKLVLIDCDAQINSVREFEPGDTLPRDFNGGGGTSHLPVFALLDEDPPVVCICLTDLETRFPSEPAYSVIWACTCDRVAPWGETVALK
jgi:predicted metal-dependent peptidase